MELLHYASLLRNRLSHGVASEMQPNRPRYAYSNSHARLLRLRSQIFKLTEVAAADPVMDLINELFNEPPQPESEDCLYLDIYAPSAPPPLGGRAVMVGIPGGAFQQGGSPYYDGSTFAAYEDMIVIFINWRLNGKYLSAYSQSKSV